MTEWTQSKPTSLLPATRPRAVPISANTAEIWIST